jgi:predicted amidohydrolase
MEGNRSVAAAQTVPVRGNVEANVAQHLRLAEVAGQEGVQVLVFPELSLTGYEIDLATELAFSERDARLAPLVDMAFSRSLTLIVGAPVRLESLHIGAFIIGSDRSIEIYTKQRLGAFSPGAIVDGVVPAAEATVFQPGDRTPLVRVGDSVAAVAVCADTGSPSHPQAAAARGAATYLASMFIIPSEFDGEAARLRAYAAEYSMALVMANFGGPSGGLAAAGRSAIWSERGDLLAQLDSARIGLALATKSRSGWRAATIELARQPF